MIKIKAYIVLTMLSRFIGLNGKSVLKVPNAYVAGWKDCLLHIRDHHGIEIELEDIK